VSISAIDRATIGDFVQPARLSAYLNARTNVSYNYGTSGGFSNPVIGLDGAVRISGIVVESDADLVTGPASPVLDRLGTRLVYDDPRGRFRLSVGDLRPATRGFQAAEDIAGFSILKSYQLLQPRYTARPRGSRSFVLDRAATVEVTSSGQVIRTLQLEPGTYDVRDFPFGQGANNIELAIVDPGGRTELLRYALFLGQNQLATGLSEYALYTGVQAPHVGNAPRYTGKLVVSGFYRRGLSDAVTLGVDVQADNKGAMGGVEFIAGSQIGALSGTFSLSQITGFGRGYAAAATFQRSLHRGNGGDDAIGVSFETRSRNFGPIGTIIPLNPYAYEVAATYSHGFGANSFANADVQFSKARAPQADLQSYRLSIGHRFSPRSTFTAVGRYESNAQRSGFQALLSIFVRFGAFSSAQFSYDTRGNQARLSYQSSHGQGVGSYSVVANVGHSDDSASGDGSISYFANRADLTFSHAALFSGDLSRSVGQVSVARVATSFAFADGAFSIGRPISNSFAIIAPHPSLGATRIEVDPVASSYTAGTGILHAATLPNLGAFSDRAVAIDAPDAPAGVDVGQGAFRLLPPYRGGYRLIVGSDYNVTAIGRLLDVLGQPVPLIAGTAVELAHPERPALQFFTNRDGKFGLSGVAPGRWRIALGADGAAHYLITIAHASTGILRTGDLKPEEAERDAP
jgi:outer membrane usher protein